MGSSIYDRLGPGFTLIEVGMKGTETSEFVASAKNRKVPLSLLKIDLPEAVMLYERRFLLVRPDQYIAWRGDSLPADVDAVLTVVTGA